MSIPPLHPKAPPKVESEPAPRGPECMDCGATLGGKFCHYCGQRKQRRVASVVSLAGEFVADIFNWDSRVWRTLWPLLAKPGHLTKAYMEGKRERHVPPIRLYLISSIVFFLLISMSPRSFLGEVSAAVELKKGDVESGLEHGLDTEITSRSGRAVLLILQALDGDPDDDTTDDIDLPYLKIDGRHVLDVDASIGADEPGEDDANNPAETPTTDQEKIDTDSAVGSENTDEEDTSGADNSPDEDDLDEMRIVDECDEVRTNESAVAFEFLREPAVKACMSMSTWGGLFTYIEELIEGLPKTLLLLLPLMALASKLLYLFAGRYYVEHLLYYVHNYSFVFLFTVLLTGISKLFSLAGVDISGLLIFAGTLYVVYYFFKSLRVVYEQGFIFTLTKWLTLMFAFFMFVSVVLAFFTVATAAMHGL